MQRGFRSSWVSWNTFGWMQSLILSLHVCQVSFPTSCMAPMATGQYGQFLYLCTSSRHLRFKLSIGRSADPLSRLSTGNCLARQHTVLHSLRTSYTHLYHQIVGPTVPKCHRAWASTIPHQGGKSNNSKLIARIIHATIRPGHAAHRLPIFLYRMILNPVHKTF